MGEPTKPQLGLLIMNKRPTKQELAQKEMDKVRKSEQRRVLEELREKAEYWEMQWKIRFYTLEAEKLQPEYNEFLEKEMIKQEEAIKRFQEEIEKMNQQTEANKVVEENKEFLSAVSSEETRPLSAV